MDDELLIDAGVSVSIKTVDLSWESDLSNIPESGRMKGNAYRKSDFHFYYPPRFSRGNFFALEIARNIREIAVIKDERRSKRWIFPVFAPGTCSTGVRVNRKYVTRRTSRKIVKCTTFLRSSPVPDRTLFNRTIPRSRVDPPFFSTRIHVCPSMRTCDR